MSTVVFVQYTDPAGYPPLQHSSLMFAERGWCVKHLGVVASGAASEINMPKHPAISIAMKPAPGGSWRTLLHYICFLAWCRREITRLRPRVVYCSDFRSYLIGIWATRLSGVYTVLHEHDPPTTGTNNLLMRVMHFVRVGFARRASIIVVPQDERAIKFIADTGCAPDKLRVVYNCPMLRELRDALTDERGTQTGMTLWYHGSLGEGQLPIAIIDALARLPADVRLEVAGYETIGNTGYMQRLMEHARRLGVEKRVYFHGAVPNRSDLLHLAAGSDLGVALFSRSFRDPMVGASNKPFDYLACGLPVLTNGTPEWDNFFGVEGVSVGCDPENPADIAGVILALRDAPERRSMMAEAGRRLILVKWNYEAQFAKVMEAIDATP